MSAVARGAALQRTTLRTSRLLDFASEKELVAQTGHRPEHWPYVILKELVDNAIDACEEAGVSPEIKVTVDDRGITVSDNGPGLRADVVESVLDFTVRVSSREAYVSPTRGAQGNALKTLVAMPFVLDGERGHIEIEALESRHRIEMRVDRIRQTPVIDHDVESSDRKIGTAVTVPLAVSPRSIDDDDRARFLQIASDYAWLNPHLRLSIDWCGEFSTFDPTEVDWKHWTPSEPTSAHWYAPDHLERLIAGYVAHDQDRGRQRTVRELVAEFRGLTGSAKQKALLTNTGLVRAPLTTFVDGDRLNRDAIETLLEAMKSTSAPVKPTRLGSIGKAHFEARFAAAGCEMESFDYKRVMGTTDGVPWIVETAFGWCPAEGNGRRLVTGVNWSPGIVNPFRELGRLGTSLDTILSRQRADRDEPVILVLHMVCPRVEYTDRGKSAVVVRS